VMMAIMMIMECPRPRMGTLSHNYCQKKMLQILSINRPKPKRDTGGISINTTIRLTPIITVIFPKENRINYHQLL